MAFHWQAFIARGFLQQVAGSVFDCREVCCCVAGSDAAFVLSERHVHHPMQVIFNLPVVANNASHFPGLNIERRDVIPSACFGYAFDFTGVFRHDDALKTWPLVMLIEPVNM